MTGRYPTVPWQMGMRRGVQALEAPRPVLGQVLTVSLRGEVGGPGGRRSSVAAGLEAYPHCSVSVNGVDEVVRDSQLQ